MSELQILEGASGTQYVGGFDEEGYAFYVDEDDGEAYYFPDDFGDFAADVGFVDNAGNLEVFGDGTGDADETARAVMADDRAQFEFAQGRAAQAHFDLETQLLAQQVNAELKRLDIDPNDFNIERFHDTHSGLLRGVRQGDQRGAEQAFERAVRASLPPKDEIAAAAAVMTRREAALGEAKAEATDQLTGEGWNPMLARAAVARSAGGDDTPVPLGEPKDEIAAAEQIMLAREIS